MSILANIVTRRLGRIADAKSAAPVQELKRRLRDMSGTRDFAGALRRNSGTIRLIAEIKKASPSKGVIRADFDPARIASIYEQSPAHAISVLTEEDFFQGRLPFLQAVKDITTKPVLRKDFIIDEYQLYESRVNSADAILLIAALLEKGQAGEYLHLAGELGLHVLFEVHSGEDLEKALAAGAGIIGINNRDLKTLKIDLSTTLRLKRDVPEGKIVVSESGIRDREDVMALAGAGIDALLIGTSLMEAEDIGRKLKALMDFS